MSGKQLIILVVAHLLFITFYKLSCDLKFCVRTTNDSICETTLRCSLSLLGKVEDITISKEFFFVVISEKSYARGGRETKKIITVAFVASFSP